jgi:hypothetical protein
MLERHAQKTPDFQIAVDTHSHAAFRASLNRGGGCCGLRLEVTGLPRRQACYVSKGRTPGWGGRRVHVLRADPRDEPIAIDAGGQVATDHDGQATEHLPFTDPGDMLKAGADPARQQFVKRDALDRRARPSQPVREGGGESTGPWAVAVLSSPTRQPREVTDPGPHRIQRAHLSPSVVTHCTENARRAADMHGNPIMKCTRPSRADVADLALRLWACTSPE